MSTHDKVLFLHPDAVFGPEVGIDGCSVVLERGSIRDWGLRSDKPTDEELAALDSSTEFATWQQERPDLREQHKAEAQAILDGINPVMFLVIEAIAEEIKEEVEEMKAGTPRPSRTVDELRADVKARIASK